MNGINKTFIYTAVAGAIIFTLVNVYLTDRLTNPRSIKNGTTPPPTSGSEWTNAGANDNLQQTPQQTVYLQGPGRQSNRTSFNGQIMTNRFTKGGNPNSTVNYEQSYAFQSWTKNPFANGTHNGYARAVNRATQDPTNQVNALVLGPGLAPDND